jgi:hypothetical protein
MFSDTIKALGEICALASHPSATVDAYRRGLRTARARAVIMPGADPDSATRAGLASALASLLHSRGNRGSDAAMRDTFTLYSALHDGDGALTTELSAVLRKHIGHD